ncbi:MAG: hypothetical protein IKC26_00060 [Clostridia bacterium]|jgi:hypothetical protein|nr:hypothetical protein [Clostridia bacterium]MBR7141922.1 hypothetical protein [Clostridia bacterium]
MTENKNYRTIHIIIPETDEEYDMLQEILSESRKRLPILEAMTKEERIEYFRRGLFPRKLDFDLDFGSTVIHVNTHFDQKSKENVIDRVRRVSDKIN